MLEQWSLDTEGKCTLNSSDSVFTGHFNTEVVEKQYLPSKLDDLTADKDLIKLYLNIFDSIMNVYRKKDMEK